MARRAKIALPKNKVVAKRIKPVGSTRHKKKKIRVLRTLVRAKRKKRRRRGLRSLFGFPYAKPASSWILDYIEYGKRLPKLDNFMKLRQGALIKTLKDIDGRTTKPKTRDGIKSYSYLMRITVEMPKGTQMMFLERHPKFPEWYKFCIIGGRSVWVDISEAIDFLSIMRKPSKSVSKKKQQ